MEPFEFEVTVSMLHPTDDIFSAYLNMILTLVILINHLIIGSATELIARKNKIN